MTRLQRDFRRANGLCVTCGEVYNGYEKCQRCRDKKNREAKRQRLPADVVSAWKQRRERYEY